MCFLLTIEVFLLAVRLFTCGEEAVCKKTNSNFRTGGTISNKTSPIFLRKSTKKETKLNFNHKYWEFPNLVVSNLVVCDFYALLRPFALFCGLAFALFCVHLRVSASERV